MFKEVTPLTIGNVWLLLRKFRYDPILDAAVHGYHGKVFTDDLMKPSLVYIRVGFTVYLAGDATHPEVDELIALIGDEVVEVICDESFLPMLKKHYKVRNRERYLFTHKSLKLEHLETIIETLDSDYFIEAIDEAVYYECLQSDWAATLVSNFDDYTHFARMGKGFVIRHGDLIVSGASSYVHYYEGKEVEICTDKDYRQKGLASVVGARFIKACILDNEIPHWDAANKVSRHLATKLGYTYLEAYTVYDVVPL